MPSINVNQKLCPCPRDIQRATFIGLPHADGCPAERVLVSCELPPAVKFAVALGECWGGSCRPGSYHHRDCPGRPIEVKCIITGETWPTSEVDEVETVGQWDFAHDGLRIVARDACRANWAAVKALVLGHTNLSALLTGPTATDLLAQRDAEFSALTDMARAEEAAVEAQERADEAFPFERYNLSPVSDHRREPRPSSVRLAAFVSHVIAAVGGLVPSGAEALPPVASPSLEAVLTDAEKMRAAILREVTRELDLRGGVSKPLGLVVLDAIRRATP